MLFNVRIAARLVISNDNGGILAVRLKGNPTYWCLPGGTLEPGEDFVTTAERESIEELGVKPKLGNVIFIQQLLSKEETKLTEVGFVVHNNTDFFDIDLSKTSHGAIEIEECRFIDINEENFFPRNLREFLPKNQKELLDLQCVIFSNPV